MLEAMTLAAVAGPLNGQLHGNEARFTRVVIDSRQVQPADLFVALKGPRFDGHDFLAQVAANGAMAALVEQHQPDVALPQLQVADTRLALGQLGQLHRAAFRGGLVGVTGSSGKTTVKEMLASILARLGPVLATRGNLNNDLGVPLMLLELAPAHHNAVIEMGASHVGEIAYTVGLARPDVAVLNNAGSAHLGEFGGYENIVRAKGEIIDGLSADGVAILNRDDPAFDIWVKRAGSRRVISFGLSPQADFHALDIRTDERGCPGFELVRQGARYRVQLNLLGRHNVSNALAAAAAASALGLAAEDIQAGLEALVPVRGRGVAQLTEGGIRVIDDTYNANPASMRAAVDLLASFAAPRIVALGDMGELGDWAAQAHRELGEYARGKVEALYGVGPLMAEAVAAFGPGAEHFDSQEALIAALQDRLSPGSSLLVKGSRSAAMEKVVAVVTGNGGEVH